MARARVGMLLFMALIAFTIVSASIWIVEYLQKILIQLERLNQNLELLQGYLKGIG